MALYCGQQMKGPVQQPKLSDSIVMRLAKHIFGSGQNITVEILFASIKFVKELKKFLLVVFV